MKIVIAGNGILGLTTAYRLLKKDQNVQVTLIGPYDNKGCASLAAAAMFNSFCEIDNGTLENKIERQKFIFNKTATPYWPDFLAALQEESGLKQEYGFGTFLINNHGSDSLEDRNFDAIIGALEHFNERYEHVRPETITNYKPSVTGRAARSIYINGEGWVNPIRLVEGLKLALAKSGRVDYVNAYVKRLQRDGDKVSYVELENGDKVSGDKYLLASGATFTEIVNASNLDIDMMRIFYGVGSSLLLKTGDTTLSNCVRTPNRGLACGVYSAPQDSAHTLIGATNNVQPYPSDNANANNIYSLLKSAMEQINTDYYRAEVVKINIGWRPTSADTLPLLGQTSISNLIVATGTKRDGLHCSPLISECMVNLIYGEPTIYDLSLFNPERKLVRIYTREEAIKIAVGHTINAAYQHDFVPSKNRMVEDLEKYYTMDLNQLHDKVGAHDWGIPPELINMYRYGHIK
jgi:glycine/D-amino acid oxidase-like deaminating enzyme